MICSTIFFVSSGLGSRPKLPELTQFPGRHCIFNIPELIGTHYKMVGTTLLDDDAGEKVASIELEKKHVASEINLQILSNWLQGKGISDRTWGGLIKVLKSFCRTLAEDIEEVVGVEDCTYHTK